MSCTTGTCPPPKCKKKPKAKCSPCSPKRKPRYYDSDSDNGCCTSDSDSGSCKQELTQDMKDKLENKDFSVAQVIALKAKIAHQVRSSDRCLLKGILSEVGGNKYMIKSLANWYTTRLNDFTQSKEAGFVLPNPGQATPEERKKVNDEITTAWNNHCSSMCGYSSAECSDDSSCSDRSRSRCRDKIQTYCKKPGDTRKVYGPIGRQNKYCGSWKKTPFGIFWKETPAAVGTSNSRGITVVAKRPIDMAGIDGMEQDQAVNVVDKVGKLWNAMKPQGISMCSDFSSCNDYKRFVWNQSRRLTAKAIPKEMVAEWKIDNICHFLEHPKTIKKYYEVRWNNYWGTSVPEETATALLNNSKYYSAKGIGCNPKLLVSRKSGRVYFAKVESDEKDANYGHLIPLNLKKLFFYHDFPKHWQSRFRKLKYLNTLKARNYKKVSGTKLFSDEEYNLKYTTKKIIRKMQNLGVTNDEKANIYIAKVRAGIEAAPDRFNEKLQMRSTMIGTYYKARNDNLYEAYATTAVKSLYDPRLTQMEPRNIKAVRDEEDKLEIVVEEPFADKWDESSAPQGQKVKRIIDTMKPWAGDDGKFDQGAVPFPKPRTKIEKMKCKK